MPRPKKPSSQKLNESINVPVNRELKKRVLRVATEKGVASYTSLARNYIERGVESDERSVATATA